MDSLADTLRALPVDGDMNTLVLKGTVAAPPELRTYPSGAVKLRILVTVRTFDPQRRTYVIPVDFWEPSQEAIDTVQHHDRVWVAGYVRRHFFPTGEGRRSRIEIVARHVEVDHDGVVGDAPDAEDDIHLPAPEGTPAAVAT